MTMNTLFVKNMVCHRCVLAVEEILRNLSIASEKVIPGEIHLEGEISNDKKEVLKDKLNEIGLELIDNRVSGLIEKIKQLVIAKARNEVDEREAKTKLSNYLTSHLHHDYSYLSNLFSSVEGRTIENYFIEQRIEKAKELLVYGQMSLSQIAFELDYSSVAHLSNQFKKITGLTPSHFKEIGSSKRKTLDSI